MAQSPARPGDGVLHPAVLGAIVLLALNDHLFKACWPGLVTGKLSDFAGMLFFPLLLQAAWELALDAVGRPWGPSRRALLLCCGATALVFAATKTWPPAAEGYRWALGALQSPFVDGPLRPVSHVMDPGDLVAVPMVGVAWALGRRRLNPPGGS